MISPDTPAAWRDDALGARSDTVRAVRRVVTGALEGQRTAKVIGSSLEAGPTVYLSAELAQIITNPDTFADLCIASQVTLVTGDAPADAFTLQDVAGVAVTWSNWIGLSAMARPIRWLCKPCSNCRNILQARGGFSGAGGVEGKVQLLRHEGAASLLI